MMKASPRRRESPGTAVGVRGSTRLALSAKMAVSGMTQNMHDPRQSATSAESKMEAIAPDFTGSDLRRREGKGSWRKSYAMGSRAALRYVTLIPYIAGDDAR